MGSGHNKAYLIGVNMSTIEIESRITLVKKTLKEIKLLVENDSIMNLSKEELQHFPELIKKTERINDIKEFIDIMDIMIETYID